MNACVCRYPQARRVHQIPGAGVVNCPMWVVGTKPGISGRADSKYP